MKTLSKHISELWISVTTLYGRNKRIKQNVIWPSFKTFQFIKVNGKTAQLIRQKGMVEAFTSLFIRKLQARKEPWVGCNSRSYHPSRQLDVLFLFLRISSNTISARNQYLKHERVEEHLEFKSHCKM